MRRRLLFLVLFFAGCQTEGTLVVQLRTDLVPGRDFVVAQTTLRPPGGTTATFDRSALDGGDWSGGVRAAEVAGLVPGRYRLTVAVRDAGGAVVLSRPASVEIDGGVAVVTVLLTRDCQGIACPAPDGDPLATACLAGRCVPETCVEERPEACAAPQCTTASDCPGADGECATRECTASGSCFLALSPDVCGDGTCGPSGRCRPASCGTFGGRRLAAGNGVTCVYAPGGPTECWGPNNGVTFGDMTTHPLPPTVVHPELVPQELWVSDAVFCGIDPTGELLCAGTDYSGELGNGPPIESHSWTAVPGVPPVTQATHAAIFRTSVCAIDGTQLRCWGSNSTGQLGQLPGTPDYVLDPLVVGGAWSRVSLNAFHGCGVQTDGTLHCWGSNVGGQLGLPMDEVLREPLQVGTDTDWADVLAGHDYTCGIKRDGRAFCWGQDYDGQLGDGPGELPRPEMPREVTVATGTRWVRLDGEERHVCGLRDDGSLWCWGNNELGQVGGPEATVEAPIQPQPGRRFADFVASREHTCALDTEGHATCWGINRDGQLPGFMGASTATPIDVCAP